MFILCQGDLAKEPYIIPISEVPVYSLEELCYYMYHNIYTVTEEFFDENLVHWLKGQVHLRTLAMKMEKLNFWMTILQLCILQIVGYKM